MTSYFLQQSAKLDIRSKLLAFQYPQISFFCLGQHFQPNFRAITVGLWQCALTPRANFRETSTAFTPHSPRTIDASTFWGLSVQCVIPDSPQNADAMPFFLNICIIHSHFNLLNQHFTSAWSADRQSPSFFETSVQITLNETRQILVDETYSFRVTMVIIFTVVFIFSSTRKALVRSNLDLKFVLR